MIIPVMFHGLEDVQASVETARKIHETLNVLEDGIKDLGLSPNLMDNLSNLKGYPKSENPAKAVLTINGHPIYPEAYKVFADWIIKMPPYIREYGNNFVPVECDAVEPQKVSELALGFSLSEFKHDHAGARKRILSLQKIELGDYRK